MRVALSAEAKRCRDRERLRLWRASNPEKVKAQRDRRKNPITDRERMRAWRQNNPDKARSIYASYRQKHPDRVKATRAAYMERSGKQKAKERAQNPNVRKSKRETSRRLYRANPTRELDRIRFKKYGLSPEAFAAMRISQSNQCAICGETFSKTPCVDHDHKTGIVRGLLCFGCNFAIGHCGDSSEKLRACADYLDRAVFGLERIA